MEESVEIFGRVSNKTSILDRLNTRRRSTIGLRIAPLVDMIFLLLIFFLVAAKWRPKEDFLPLQLPAAGAGVQTMAKPEPLTIQILAAQTSGGCRVQIGPSQIVDVAAQNPEQGLAALMEKTRQCMLEQKRYASDPVEIVCSAEVKWEYLAKIYNVFVGMGLTDITFQMTEDSANASGQ
jgi:biopolymer transport protein ExbD